MKVRNCGLMKSIPKATKTSTTGPIFLLPPKLATPRTIGEPSSTFPRHFDNPHHPGHVNYTFHPPTTTPTSTPTPRTTTQRGISYLKPSDIPISYLKPPQRRAPAQAVTSSHKKRSLYIMSAPFAYECCAAPHTAKFASNARKPFPRINLYVLAGKKFHHRKSANVPEFPVCYRRFPGCSRRFPGCFPGCSRGVPVFVFGYGSSPRQTSRKGLKTFTLPMVRNLINKFSQMLQSATDTQ